MARIHRSRIEAITKSGSFFDRKLGLGTRPSVRVRNRERVKIKRVKIIYDLKYEIKLRVRE